MAKYVYGPVPSRRLGRSLGVDLVPAKTCTLNCVYCQLGPTARTTVERREYVPTDAVVAEVLGRLAEIERPDFISLAGSGEPTLHLGFGEVAAGIRAGSDVPIALITNGTLFGRPEVRAACDAIDLVLPSLDAGDEETFRRVNRPHAEVTLARLVEGLVALRREYAGEIWLEVFIVEGLNSSDEQVERIRAQIERIRPHRVQINTAVRPPAEPDVRAPSAERLEEIRAMLGPNAEVIARAHPLPLSGEAAAQKDEVAAMLRRRPCTLEDIAAGLGMRPTDALKLVQALLDEGAIRRRQRLYDTYYEASGL